MLSSLLFVGTSYTTVSTRVDRIIAIFEVDENQLLGNFNGRIKTVHFDIYQGQTTQMNCSFVGKKRDIAKILDLVINCPRCFFKQLIGH